MVDNIKCSLIEPRLNRTIAHFEKSYFEHEKCNACSLTNTFRFLLNDLAIL